MELLQVKNVSKTYRNGLQRKKVLNNINLSVLKGSFIAIVGPSGSGKSTLLHILGGLETPNTGEVIIDKTSLYSLSDDQLTIFRRRQIGMIYQFYNLIPTLTVQENIMMPLLLDNKEVEKNYLNQIITTLSISDIMNLYPAQLSGGQQQRVAIARALIHHPSLVLADEPTGNLDSIVTREIVDLLKLLCKRSNTTIVMITHDMNIAMQADCIFEMNDGILKQFED